MLFRHRDPISLLLKGNSMRSLTWKMSGCLFAALWVCAAGFPAQADDLVGLTRLATYPLLVGMDSDDPTVPTSIQLLIGLATDEQLVGIDLRPATGQIYGVGRNTKTGTLQLYVIDAMTVAAMATPVGAPFTPPPLLRGQPKPTEFGFDFNPTIDRVRLVADNDMNIVFNPDTGAVAMPLATNLFYATGAAPDTNPVPDVNAGKNPNVVGIAYDNNDLDPATGSQQRGIDTKLDVLVTVANNTGRLRTIGRLGVNVTAVAGYDVSSTTNVKSFAVMNSVGRRLQGLYAIDNVTGRATLVGTPVMGLFEYTGLTVLDAPVAPSAN